MTGPIILFVAVAYALSIGLSLFIGLTGGHQSPYIGIAIVSMLFPAIAVVAVRLFAGAQWPAGFKRFPLGWALMALLLIPLVMHAAMLPTVAFYEGRLPWEGWLLSPGADGLYHAPATRGWGDMTAGALAARLALNAGLGLVVVSALALFEEIGWRAWLLPRLAERMAAGPAILLMAVIAAGWHIPYPLSGIHDVEGIDPMALACIMTVGHIGSACILGWLWMRSKSVWIVAIGHGALNNWGQYAFKFMQPEHANAAVILMAGNLALLLVGLILAFGLSGDRRGASQPLAAA
jgi:membrane protease YdiL (CAAX protease family)